ncbi:unnamed protein product [Ixodes pacificus]
MKFPASFDVCKVKQALEYQARPGDVILSTYPKSGTTWMQYIVWCLCHMDEMDAGRLPNIGRMLAEEFPFIEWVGTDVLKNRQPPRLIKHHLPQSMSPHHPEAKHIVVVRNPFDVFVSWVHAKREALGVGCEDVDTLLHRFLSGDLEYGCYFEHLFSWYAKRGDTNVLLVFYERLKEDFKSVAMEIAHFLDVPGVVKRLDQGLVDKLQEVTSLKNLRLTVTSSDVAVNTSQKPRKHIQHNLFREGVAGNWARHLSADQETRLRQIYNEKIAGTDMYSVWKPYVERH